jgi:excisionase family DNA binding protein
MRPAADPLGVLVDAIAAAVVERLAEKLPKPEPARAPTQPAAWLSMREAAAYLGFATKTLESWRAAGTGPSPKKVGRRLRYARADLDKWATSNPRIAQRAKRRHQRRS